MLIFGGGAWPEHRRWCIAVATLAFLATAWYGIASYRASALLGGGSLPGLTLGIAGGLIIVFEMLLWPRKKYRTARIGRVKEWMRAHIWLGFLSVPFLILHSGFQIRLASLSGMLMITFLGVILSGCWGLVLQQYLPKLMMEHVPAETIRSQIDRILGLQLEEVTRVVRITCGLDQASGTSAGPQEERSQLVIGAVRTTGAVQGKQFKAAFVARRIQGTEPLLGFFETTVRPYLAARNGERNPLGSAKRATPIFREVRTRLVPEAHPVVDLIEELCDQRRQFDLQARIHSWLHGWLMVHLPLSAAMFVLMLAHVYYALRYL